MIYIIFYQYNETTLNEITLSKDLQDLKSWIVQFVAPNIAGIIAIIIIFIITIIVITIIISQPINYKVWNACKEITHNH